MPEFPTYDYEVLEVSRLGLLASLKQGGKEGYRVISLVERERTFLIVFERPVSLKLDRNLNEIEEN